MQYIEFGSTGKRISKVVLGCMRFPELSVPEITSLVQFAFDHGINALDIADIYTRGKAETLLGDALAGVPGLRDKLFIQTKCGIRKDPHCYDFSKEHILEAVEGSLKRLKTDHVDSLLLHRPDVLMEPEEVGEAFLKLHQEGKVLDFGVSNFNPAQMELLQSGLGFKIAADQVQLSVCHTPMIDHGIHVNMVENDLAQNRDGSILEYCRLKGITVQAWSVMQHGFFKGVFIGDPQYLRLNSVLDRIADEQGVKSSAVAIAWILRIPGKIQGIIGTTKQSRVEIATHATDVKLTRGQWYEIYLAAGNDIP